MSVYIFRHQVIMDEDDLISRLSLDSAGSGKSVHVTASGSGDNQFTFVINENAEEMDDMEEEELGDSELENVASSVNEATELTAEDETKQRERELTDKYLAGQLSFKDFVQEINNEEKDEEEEELEGPETPAESISVEVIIADEEGIIILHSLKPIILNPRVEFLSGAYKNY